MLRRIIGFSLLAMYATNMWTGAVNGSLHLKIILRASSVPDRHVYRYVILCIQSPFVTILAIAISVPQSELE